jgi:WD40 repeat protein
MSTQSTDLNPYVGPHPFRPEQRHLFFGREREASELLALVIANRVVLFFAQSGAGKSSLINARLIPELEGKQFEVLPVGRVSGEKPAGLEVDNIFVFNLVDYLNQVDVEDTTLAQLPLCDFLVHLTHTGGKWVYEKAAAETEAAAEVAPEMISELAGAGEAVASSAAPSAEELEIRPRMLIIDQFEEILTAHPEAWEQRTDFFVQIRQSLEEDPYLWVLFAMREDFVGALSPYAHLLPEGLRIRYHMLPMDEASGLAAVKQPAALYGHAFAPGVAELLIKNLRQIDEQQPQNGNGARLGQFVEPVQLQVVCRQLWDSVDTPPGTPITMADLEKLAGGAGPEEFVNDALRVYYDQSLLFALAEAPEGVSERSLRNWFDQVVITEDGKRNLIHQGDDESEGVPNDVVKALVDRFILRRETRGERRWIELAHDRFVEPIRRSNRQWFAREPSPTMAWAELWLNANKDPTLLLEGDKLAETVARLQAHPNDFQPLEQEFIRTSEEAAKKEAEKRRRLLISALTASVVALLSIVAIIFLMWFNELATRQEAVVARATAVSAQATAVGAKATAESAKATAESALAETQVRERAARADGLAVKSAGLLDWPQLALLLAAQSAAIQRAAGEEVAPAVEQALHGVLGSTGGTLVPLGQADADPYAVALSEDGRLAVDAAPGVVLVRDLANADGASLTLPDHEGIVHALHFVPGRNALVSLDDSGAIRVWDLSATPPQAALLNEGGEPAWAIALFTDTLASAGVDGRVRLWNLDQPGEPLREWEGEGGLATLADFSRDGRYLATAGNDYDQGSVRVWDVTAASPLTATIAVRGAQVGALAASPTTDQLAVSWDDGTIRLYDLPGLAETALPLRGPNQAATSLAFLRDAGGLQLAATYAGDNKVWVWDVDNPQGEPALLRGHAGEIRRLAAGPQNVMATTGAGGEVRIWEQHNLAYEPESVFTAENPVVHMALSAGGDSLAAALVGDGRAHMQALDGSQPPRTVGDGAAGDVSAVAFGAGDDVLLAGTVTGALGAWPLDAAPTAPPLWTSAGHDARINDIAVEPVLGIVATAGDDGTVRTWDPAGGRQLVTLTLSTPAPLVEVAFSPDGALLAAAGLDGLVHLWDAASGEEMPPLGEETGGSGFTSLAFDAGSGRLELAAAKEDGTIWRWELPGRTPLPSPPPREPVRAIAYDRRHLITGHDNGAIYLWYLDAMDALPASLAGGTAAVNELIVDPEHAAYLLAAVDDGYVRRWDLAVEALVEKACRGAGRPLSQEERSSYLPRHGSGPAAGDACAQIRAP